MPDGFGLFDRNVMLMAREDISRARPNNRNGEGAVRSLSSL